jgi:hypothetical protein
MTEVAVSIPPVADAARFELAVGHNGAYLGSFANTFSNKRSMVQSLSKSKAGSSFRLKQSLEEVIIRLAVPQANIKPSYGSNLCGPGPRELLPGFSPSPMHASQGKRLDSRPFPQLIVVEIPIHLIFHGSDFRTSAPGAKKKVKRELRLFHSEH